MCAARCLTGALQQVAVVVEAVLAVALVTRRRVLAVAPLADLLGEQGALVDVCRPGRNNVLKDFTSCVVMLLKLPSTEVYLLYGITVLRSFQAFT